MELAIPLFFLGWRIDLCVFPESVCNPSFLWPAKERDGELEGKLDVGIPEAEAVALDTGFAEDFVFAVFRFDEIDSSTDIFALFREELFDAIKPELFLEAGADEILLSWFALAESDGCELGL